MDNFSGDLTASIATVNPVNTTVPAVYTVTYNVVDQSSNAATQVTRTVTVQDNVDPLVTLTGASTISISCSTGYNELGATATDACDGALTPVVTGTVNTILPGNYIVTYTATDAAGNDASVTRTVTVLSDCPAILITADTATSVTVEEEQGPVTFKITAIGSGTLDYQWFFDNGAKAPAILPGEITNTLEIDAPIIIPQAGQYYCEVTDGITTVSSPLFTLNVVAQMPVAGVLGMIAIAGATAMSGGAALRRKRR